MATITKGKTFGGTEQVTSTKLHELVDSATIAAIATADISDSAITAGKIAADAVTTAKILDANVTEGKIATEAVTAGKLGVAAVDLGGTKITGTTAIANGGTGQTAQTPAFDALAPTTTEGDIIYHNGTDNVRLAKGTSLQRFRMNAGATAPEWFTAGDVEVIIVQDQKAQNTAGDQTTSGDWRTMTLNTEVADSGGYCTLALNQMTLSAGTYSFDIFVPVSAPSRFQARLQNITAGTTTQYGTAGSAVYNGYSVIQGRVTIVGATVFEVQLQVQVTGTVAAGNFGTEVYTTVKFVRE